MIDNNSEEMKKLVKKLDDFLISKHIFCKSEWLNEKLVTLKTSKKLEEDIMKEVVNTDINLIIDKERIKSKFNLSSQPKFSKFYELNNYFLMQIIGYSNIAEPSENLNKSSNNLDVLDNLDSKFLQSEGEEKKKTEKILLKFEMTEGIDKYYGFEYENLNELKASFNSSSNKFPKIILGPKTEIRRGILFLRNNNTKLLS